MDLASKYRPRCLDEVIGQPHIVSTLGTMLSTKTIPRVLLFSGSHGCGKTTCAQIFARLTNCASVGLPGCECEFCENTSLFIEWDCAIRNKVDDAAYVVDVARMAVPYGKKRVILLDECHNMSAAAFDKFLKPMESPQKKFGVQGQDVDSDPTVFVLSTTREDKIPPTLRSRAMILRFRDVSPELIKGRLEFILEAEQLSLPTEVLLSLSRVGDMRSAISQMSAILQAPEHWKNIIGDSPESLANLFIKDILSNTSTSMCKLAEAFPDRMSFQRFLQEVARSFPRKDMILYSKVIELTFHLYFIHHSIAIPRMYTVLQQEETHGTTTTEPPVRRAIPEEPLPANEFPAAPEAPSSSLPESGGNVPPPSAYRRRRR